jgi:hypothetical protein
VSRGMAREGYFDVIFEQRFDRNDELAYANI